MNLAAGAVDGSVDVLVGHSGAGALLPLLADRLDTDVTVYVDAVVPGDDADHVATAGFLELLDRLPREADDPLLPPWDTWWGPDTMTRLVPDDTLRAGLVDEMPRLPRRVLRRSRAAAPGLDGSPRLLLPPARPGVRRRTSACGRARLADRSDRWRAPRHRGAPDRGGRSGACAHRTGTPRLSVSPTSSAQPRQPRLRANSANRRSQWRSAAGLSYTGRSGNAKPWCTPA